MEYCAGGDLAKFIRRTKRIPEATARALLRQLSAGLRELWSRNLVHVIRAHISSDSESVSCPAEEQLVFNAFTYRLPGTSSICVQAESLVST